MAEGAEGRRGGGGSGHLHDWNDESGSGWGALPPGNPRNLRREKRVQKAPVQKIYFKDIDHEQNLGLISFWVLREYLNTSAPTSKIRLRGEVQRKGRASALYSAGLKCALGLLPRCGAVVDAV